MFFTSANALVFATLDDKQASQATAISATTQQVSIALGVAVAGGVLELSGLITGQATSIESFHVALIAVAIITALSVIPFLGMAPEAGNAVSGYRLQAAEEAAAVKSD
jgi:hypothetical protein